MKENPTMKNEKCCYDTTKNKPPRASKYSNIWFPSDTCMQHAQSHGSCWTIIRHLHATCTKSWIMLNYYPTLACNMHKVMDHAELLSDKQVPHSGSIADHQVPHSTLSSLYFKDVQECQFQPIALRIPAISPKPSQDSNNESIPRNQTIVKV